MPEYVVRTFDVYNTSVLLPYYTLPGYEKELQLSKEFYSTDFSSNPIGSKVDFFRQLDDPCYSLANPNPVFSVSTSLSALSPLWFDQWWDEAMYYSHPLVLQQLQQSNPAVYQSFSDSVGTFYYVPDETSPVTPALNRKIPKNIMSKMSQLNSLLSSNFKSFTPKGLGPNNTKFLEQLAEYKKAADTVKSLVNKQFDPIKRKLPLNVVQTGNLVTPPNWKFNVNVQGINAAMDKVGNVLNKPKALLSKAINKVRSFIPTIKLPPLPNIGKMISAAIPGLPAVSNLYNSLKSAASQIQSAVATAQATVAAAQNVITEGKNAIGAVQNAVNNVTGTVKQLTTPGGAGAALTSITRTVGNNNVISALKNQTGVAPSNLNNNALVLVNKSAKNSIGNNSTTTVNTFTYKS